MLKALLFLIHLAYLYWILQVLGNAGVWSLQKVLIQFILLALAGGFLIYTSKLEANK